MATVNLGRIKPVFRGAYSGSTAYVVDDIVTSGGSSYICIQAHGAGTQAVTQTAYWSVLASTGTDVGTTLTTSGDILYRDGSGLQRLAKGTASQTLQMDGSAAFPTWTTVAAASTDYEKITSASFTAAATINLTDASWGTGYDTHLIHLHLYSGGSGTGNNLAFKFSTDDGSSYASTGHSSVTCHLNSAGSGTAGAYVQDNQASVVFGGDGFSPTWGFAQIWCSGLTNTQEKMFNFHYTRANQDGATRCISSVGGGLYNGTSDANNQLQFYNHAGHNLIGRYVVYGIKG